MGIERDFLGWERPFGVAVGDWLWERKDRLPGMMIVVPTAQSGRRHSGYSGHLYHRTE